MRPIITVLLILTLSGCSSIQKYQSYEGVDPTFKRMLLFTGKASDNYFQEHSPEEIRRKSNAGIGKITAPLTPVKTIRDLRIRTDYGSLPVRVYYPSEKTAGMPLIVFFHGGAFFMCSLDTHENICRYLCSNLPGIVVSVDYRLAPEHPFPEPLNDCILAVAWAAENAASLGADPGQIIVAGDSAGGNLAAAVCLHARDKCGPRIAAQLLLYPALDMRETWYASRLDYREGFFLTERLMRYTLELYRPDINAAYASPVIADDLTGLPPAAIVTAEFDPLRDEGELYARRLFEAGNHVSLTRYKGMIHGFISMDALVDEAHLALDRSARELRKILASGSDAAAAH